MKIHLFQKERQKNQDTEKNHGVSGKKSRDFAKEK